MVVAIVQIVSVCVCILATSQTLMLIKCEYMSPRWKKNRWKQASVYRCTVFSLSTSSLLLFYFLVCCVLLSSLSPLLDSSVSHTRSGKHANSHAIAVHVFIMFWQPCSSKNGIILSWRWTQTGSNCAITQTVCWMTWTGLTEIKARRVYCPVRRGGWFIRFCRISKHLDLLWGAGYPKIPPKSILFLLHRVSVCFTSGLLECKGSKTYIQKCQHRRLVPENYNERPVHESYLLATAHVPNRCHQQQAARQMAVSRLSCCIDLRCWRSANWFAGFSTFMVKTSESMQSVCWMLRLLCALKGQCSQNLNFTHYLLTAVSMEALQIILLEFHGRKEFHPMSIQWKPMMGM